MLNVSGKPQSWFSPRKQLKLKPGNKAVEDVPSDGDDDSSSKSVPLLASSDEAFCSMLLPW